MSVPFFGFTAFSSVIGCCGVVLNFIVCILYITNPKLLDSANIFVFNISVGDFIYSIVALPMLVMSNAKGKWLFGEAGCTAYGFITTFVALGSMMNLVGASYERYVTLVKLYRNGEADFGIKKALCVSIILWLYSLIWSSMPLFGWSSYTLEGIGTSCSIEWRSDNSGDVSYALCLTTACFVLPMSVIIYCYHKSYRALRQLSSLAVQNWGENARVTQETIQAQRKMAFIIMAITIGFVVAWTPYAIVSLVSMFGPHLVSDIGASIPAYIAKSSACYNPIIYVFIYKKFRRRLRCLLWFRKTRVVPGQVVTDRPTVNSTERKEIRSYPLSSAAAGRQQTDDLKD